MRETDKYVMFWKMDDVLSNWHFTPKGINFFGYPHETLTAPTVEHVFNWMKAFYFADYNTASEILKVKTPKEAKDLGKMIKNFDAELWETVREDCMFECLRYRFKSDAEFRDVLMNDKYMDKTFVEANPFDTIWGIAMNESDPHANDEKSWQGKNLLGICLGRIRQYYIDKKANSHN